ncbi:methyltransferase domain-containing protein [Candidatus Azambacteria bacterium]|nr:methyltransferase domain-containing protein [Candidatus Azambacteria bacterium]MBI3685622.1 methyltransferase domain-containing protein [Candidatus Azambacteria bacterium]
MDTKKRINQETVNAVWRKAWEDQGAASSRAVFKHRLFIEGYPIFKRYIPQNMRSILEIGGGSGRYGLAFAKDFPKSTVVISDILPESLEMVKKMGSELGLRNVVMQKEDALRLSFPDNHFDVVFADVVIQHIPEYQEAVSEMARVLKPGGCLIISVVNARNFHMLYKILLRILGKEYPYGYEKSFTKKELRNVLRESDLVISAEDGFYVAYGIYRLKYISRIFGLFGKVCNRAVKMIDSVSGRFISRHFGFEIVIVGKK